MKLSLLPKARYFLTVILLLFFIIPGTSHAAGVLPDVETRSIIQSVDGYAKVVGDKKPKQLRHGALSIAKRKALESARKYLESGTKGKYEIVKNRHGKFITVLDKKDFGIENSSRYHVRLKTEVRYRQKNSTMEEAAPLTVKIWTDKKKYKEGEQINIYIEGNRDFYAKIVKMGASGDIVQLLPNNYRQISLFKKGETYRIPDEGDRFDLKVFPPFGTERFIVYASELPLSRINMKTIAKGLYRYRGTKRSLDRSVRSTVPVGKGRPVEFYEAVRTILKAPH
ncbi:MAG: DUF4384 domain-containing protein [Proteobacteria bacterium]|nr:DUF4384 domain-containing protein [Pseudomonadota bacterium]